MAIFKRDEEQELLDAEWASIAEQRGYSKKEAEARREQLCGLALSGGGIRSASFALGVLQALARDPKVPAIDYLSTVSGGGYIGSTLSWLLREDPPEKSASPLAIGDQRQSIRNIGEDKTVKIRTAILNYLRQHGNYLVPTSSLNFISLIAVVIRSIFLSLSVYVPLLVLALLFLAWIGANFSDWIWLKPIGRQELLGLVAYLWIALALAAIFLLACVVYSLLTFLGRSFLPNRYQDRIWAQEASGWILTGVVCFALIGSLPIARRLLDAGIVQATGQAPQDAWAAGIVGAVASLIGLAGGFFEFLEKTAPKQNGDRKTKAASRSDLIVKLAAVLLIYGLLLLSYSLATVFAELPNLGWILLASYAAATGFLVNLNYISLHRMYRDRLMETFLPDDEAVRENRWKPASEADKTLLKDLISNAARGPYHLINTNVVLVDGKEAKYRGRGGDNFILSPLFCGSHATGWRSTDSYMMSRFSRGMTLPTAMAISGAAVNPDTGVAGKGPTRSRSVSFLMTLLNIRLGYWAPNPGHERKLRLPPNYFWPGLKGLRGKGFDESARVIELTDGGHFDNMGLYELIRRRVKLIVVSDGTGDPHFNFSDFGILVERVRVDFGVNIRFSVSKTDLTGILPGSTPVEKDSPSDEAFRAKYPMADRGYAIGTIHYPPASANSDSNLGVIVYIKSTLTKKLPADIYGYKTSNPSFPDQSTADQFFDESQFEAYRELGYRLAKSVPWETVAKTVADTDG